MRAARAGSLLALLLDVVMLSDGHLSLWRPMGLLGSFFDAQGRALLHGHLAVPASSVSFEGFLVGGHTYMYFGPVPALLRIPVLLFTHALDGRLSQLSMLLALVVLMASGARVHWQLRELVRPQAPVDQGERAAAFLVALGLGAGGVPLFLANWPVVYHETELWGAALSLAALDAVLGVIARPTGKRIARAGTLCVLAVNTRVSVGLGPVIALALLAAGLLARAATARFARRPRAARVVCWLGDLGPAEPTRRGRTIALLAIAALVAVGSSVAVNEAKFKTPFGLPMYEQVNTQIDPVQRAAVDANHGSLLGAQFVPTTLLAVVRPDAIGTTRAFPFVGLPDSPPTVIGSARFIAILPSLSAFTSMPLFCLLLLVGLPACARRPRLRPVLGVLAGTAAAFVVTLAVASVATRYLADLLPFLFLAACVGLHTLLGSARLRSRAWRRCALVAMSVLVLAAIVINGATGLLMQRLLVPTASARERASFVRAQDDIDRLVARKPHGLHTGAEIPPAALGPLGDLFILGRCAGLYVESFSGAWLPVERSQRTGLYGFDVRFPSGQAASVPEALLTLGAGSQRVGVVVTGRVFSVTIGGRTALVGARAPVHTGQRARVTVSIDPLNGAWYLSIRVGDGGSLLTVAVPYRRLATVHVGADPSDARLRRFSGSISAIPGPTPVCDQLARRAGLL